MQLPDSLPVETGFQNVVIGYWDDDIRCSTWRCIHSLGWNGRFGVQSLRRPSAFCVPILHAPRAGGWHLLGTGVVAVKASRSRRQLGTVPANLVAIRAEWCRWQTFFVE